MVKELKPQQRVDFVIRFQGSGREENEFIHHLIISDEAYFHLNVSSIRQRLHIRVDCILLESWFGEV